MSDSERLGIMETKIDQIEHDLKNLRDQVGSILKSQQRMELLLAGDETPINPGLIRRFIATEELVAWAKNKKIWAVGFFAAFSVIAALVWGVGEIVLRIKEIKEALK